MSDRAGAKALPISMEELQEVYQVVRAGESSITARERLPSRNRSTVNRAYRVLRELELRQLNRLDAATAGEIAETARYGASGGYVEKLYLAWRGYQEIARAGGHADLLTAIADEWPEGFLSTTKETLRGPAARRWSTGREQRVGDDFALDLGELKLVKGVKFLQGKPHQRDCPKKWKLHLSDENRIVWEKEGEGFIEVEFEEAVVARWIGAVILEPRLPEDHPPASCWAVDNIEIHFGE